MNRYKFKEYKKIYTEITISNSAVEQNWSLLSDHLPEQSSPSFLLIPHGALFAGAFVALCIVIGVLSYMSKPGSFLYPVNKLTQQVSKNMTGNLPKVDQQVTPPIIHSVSNTLKRAPTPTAKPAPTRQITAKEEQKTLIRGKNDIPTSTKVFGTQTQHEIIRVPTQITHQNSFNTFHQDNSWSDKGNEKNTESPINNYVNEHHQ